MLKLSTCVINGFTECTSLCKNLSCLNLINSDKWQIFPDLLAAISFMYRDAEFRTVMYASCSSDMVHDQPLVMSLSSQFLDPRDTSLCHHISGMAGRNRPIMAILWCKIVQIIYIVNCRVWEDSVKVTKEWRIRDKRRRLNRWDIKWHWKDSVALSHYITVNYVNYTVFIRALIP